MSHIFCFDHIKMGYLDLWVTWDGMVLLNKIVTSVVNIYPLKNTWGKHNFT